MALLETIEPSELLDFFVDLGEIELNETIWELYLTSDKQLGYSEFKEKIMKKKPKSKEMSQKEEQQAIEKAENILKFSQFREMEV